MDEAAIREVEEDLVDWGIVERAPALQLTRRFRGALMRAFSRLQEEEQAGRRVEEDPIARAMEEALRDVPLPPGAVTDDAHRAFLVALHVASLPPAVRQLLGL